MTRDAVVAGGMALSLAVLMTTHIALVTVLANREPRWRAAVALMMPPLAPFWGLREGVPRMKFAAQIWVASAAIYAALRLFAT